MKILTAKQTREWDAASLRRQSISSLSLMERAATACTDWLVAHYPASRPFLVLCGSGNNGGDGLAITRLLLSKGYTATALLLDGEKQLSADCAANREALKQVNADACILTNPTQFISSLPREIVLIDALFGTGLSRPIEGYFRNWVQRLNEFHNEKIAIDLPSGLNADALPDDGTTILQATHTLSFQQYKRSTLHPEAGRFCGQIHRLNIGLDLEFPEQIPCHWHTLEASELQQIYRPRNRFVHKGNLGLACLVAGSYGMMGAAVLVAQAAARSGAGKVLGLLPERGYDIFQTSIPEAMCHTCGQEYLDTIEGWEQAQGIGVGPALGRNAQTASALRSFLKKTDRPLVLDADALNILAENKSWWKQVPKRSILTPHPKEFKGLFGPSENSFARAERARSMAVKYQWTIIAKDAFSIVALPDGSCHYVTQGSPGMATAGSGDVLLGIVTGLLAQGYTPEEAALLGAYLHAVAGSFAAAQKGVESMLAGDIIAQLGAAYSTLR
ncbi:MAG: NAD(P)H-hydrate dehydratase [Bacteroidetes bacterium]|nr:NAD(P)H-hydrate dehydratase [Bacteroidota bacterium]